MELNPLVSVVIPTFNRKASLKDTLDSLTLQTLPADIFEVIVVDDGSSDETEEIAKEPFPYNLRYFRQKNQGDAIARNLGVQQSQAELLISLDDDIILEPDYLRNLIEEFQDDQDKIVMGTAYFWTDDSNPLTDNSRFKKIPKNLELKQEIPFVEVNTHSMSIKRENYISLGMMQDLQRLGNSSWKNSIWSDVDFAYRAYLQGFRFFRIRTAISWHRDYVFKNFEIRKNRSEEVGFRAISLFQKYPELINHLPMFYDKTPIHWRNDSPFLVLRKFIRKLASTRPVLWGLEQVGDYIELQNQSSPLGEILIRWIIGGYLFRGFHRGLNELGRSGSFSKYHPPNIF